MISYDKKKNTKIYINTVRRFITPTHYDLYIYIYYGMHYNLYIIHIIYIFLHCILLLFDSLATNVYYLKREMLCLRRIVSCELYYIYILYIYIFPASRRRKSLPRIYLYIYYYIINEWLVRNLLSNLYIPIYLYSTSCYTFRFLYTFLLFFYG